jgi:serine/threonine protein kinase
MSTKRIPENEIISSTDLNRTIRNDDSVISSSYDSSNVISSSLTGEFFINGIKYRIEKQIARSGEAEIFLVSTDRSQFAFKYYYSQFKPKDEILVKLKGLKHPEIISLIDYGYYQNRFFEVSEFAKGGTLQEIMPLTSVKRLKEIVSEIIEALNHCHNNGIIHRDIKPENIFFRTTEKTDLAIGDFGIASNVKEGEELVRTSLARTSLYAAPELFTNIQGKTTIEKSVDYYALGMTLLHLWFGKNPFEDIDEFGIMRLKTEGRVLFPENIPDDVENLIKGLITVNPRDRWSYDEVKGWLEGKDVKVHYQTIQFEFKPYSFGIIDGEQIVVNNPKDLTLYLEKYPEKGEGHLYRNTIAKWIEPVDPGLFNDLMDIVEKDFPKDKVAGLTKAIYVLDSEKPFLGFDKTKLKSQEEIANYFEQHFDYCSKALQNPNAAFYIFLESRNYKEKAQEYRNLFTTYDPELALNTLILTLQGGDKYIIGNYTIYQPEELIKVDSSTKSQIVSQLSNLNSKLSIWISGFKELQASIDKWRLLKKFDRITLRYALQQGFEFNKKNVKTHSEFQDLLKINFSSFISNEDTGKNKRAANYWLVNYCDTSLTEAIVEYFNNNTSSDIEFLLMLKHILEEHHETGLNIYQVFEKIMPAIKAKLSENNKLFKSVLDLHVLNIENYWNEDYKTKSLFYLDCIKNYLTFVENNYNFYSEYFSKNLSQSDNIIATHIRKDIDKIKGDKKRVESYKSELKKLVERINKLIPDLPYPKRFENELALIEKNAKKISKKNNLEKEEKIVKTHEKFNTYIEQNQNNFQFDEKQESKYLLFQLLCLSSFILLLFSFFGGQSILSAIPALCLILFTGIGIYFGVKTNSCYPIIAGFVLGAFIGSGSLGENVNINSLIYISLISFLILLYIVFYLKRSMKNVINDVGLDSHQQIALKQSLLEVDRHFEKKEKQEILQEEIRLILLDDKKFQKEFLKISQDS